MKKIAIVAIVALSISASSVLAMSSDHYQINSDTINAGGNLSSSDNYGALDSIGESFVGAMASTDFAIGGGFEPMVNTSLALSLDSATKNLGSLNPGVPVTATTTATVTTDSWGGYDLLISQDSDLKHTDTVTTIPGYACSIASPCAWSGVGLGFTVSSGTSVEGKWGTDPNFAYAAISETPTIFHTKAGYQSGEDATVVQYKVDALPSQKSGTYSNILTYTAIAKL